MYQIASGGRIVTTQPYYGDDEYVDDTPMQARSTHEVIVTDIDWRELLRALNVKAVIA